MKHEPIDDLFRRRLEQHETPPSPAGWDRLNDMLEAKESDSGKGKKKGFIWYSVAAAVIAIALFFTYRADNQDTQLAETPAELAEESPTLADATSESPAKEVIEETVGEEEEAVTIPAEELIPENREAATMVAQQTEPSPAPQKRPDILPKEPVIQTQQVVAYTEPVEKVATLPEIGTKEEVKAEPAMDMVLPDLPEIDPETAVASLEPERTKTPITISYIDAPDEKAKDKKLSMKRIIGFAKDLKEGEVGLGEIRDAKENLLAGRFGSRATD